MAVGRFGTSAAAAQNGWDPRARIAHTEQPQATADSSADAISALVIAARGGDASAWDALFDHFHPVVMRYAAARLGEREAAEDITQEVFVAVVQSIGRLRDTSRPAIEGWLLRITAHKVADRIRRLRRERRLQPQRDSVADAGEVALTRLTASEMRVALERLSAEQREVIIRRFLLDESLDHVAQTTGRSLSAVKAMQRRALASLARLIEERA